MKVLETQIFRSTNEYLAVVEKSGKEFSAPYHCHPELEIVYIKQGSGKCIIGDTVTTFNKGDIAVIGSGLPHIWTSSDLEKGEKPKSIVAYFNKDLFNSNFYKMRDVQKLVDFLDRSARGLKIVGEARELVAGRIERLTRRKGFKKVIGLLEILNSMSLSRDTYFITPENGQPVNSFITSDRLSNVYQYILDNFKRDISLEEISSLANLTPPAFCRLFKSRTNKHFVEYLNEIRISYACKQLQETDKTINTISFECGFNTISNFNKRFKAVMGLSPKHYRNSIYSLDGTLRSQRRTVAANPMD